MLVDIVMPKMGESITEGTVLEWRKQPGDMIRKDEILLEIGTDKVDSEIPSAHSGKLVEILVEPNQTVDVGFVIAKIETESNEEVQVTMKEEAPPKKLLSKKNEKQSSAPVKKEVQDRSKGFFTPVVLKIAAENDISLDNLSQIQGSGRSGRVTKKDILDYLSKKPDDTISSSEEIPSGVIPSLAGETIQMDHIRKKISEHMRHSLDTSAHVYLSAEVDMTRIMRFIKMESGAFKAREGFSLTVTPFIMSAVVKALKAVPEMNASLDGTTITYHRNINLGIAVAVENGLLVPTVSACDELNFLGICRKLKDVASRARSKKILPDELQGSTFSISNFGVFNVKIGFPIINQPNVGILGVGTIKKQPIVIESEDGDTIAIRSIGTLSLSFDHRLIDGAGGSRFMDLVRHNLESADLKDLF